MAKLKMPVAYIVCVAAGNKACEILTYGRKMANEVAARAKVEGVWEARNGYRWMMISPHEVKKVTITRRK